MKALWPRRSQKPAEVVSPPRDGKETVKEKKLNICQACEAFDISQTCYRYELKLSAENERMPLG
jgi:hypothetical protein